MPLLPKRPDPLPRKKVSAPRVSLRKPKAPKSTKGNVYRSTPPKVQRLPAVGAAGAPATPAAPYMAGAPAKPAPYAEYAGTPWAQQMLMGIDKDQEAHQNQARQTGAWLQQALTGLTGVDPSNPGLNPGLQQQYLANVQGIVGSAMSAATAGAAGPQFAATTPGGSTASPLAYLSQAAAEGNVGRSSAMLQGAQVQSALNTLQPNTQAQAYIRSYADMQAGLPALYANRRAEARMKIDEFIQNAQADAAKLAEDARHNKVQEATSAWNAQTNAAMAAGRLGLDTTKFGADQAAELNAASQPVPEGVIRLPDGSYRNDPTYSPPKAPKPSTAGKYDPNTLSKQGYVGGWRVKPKKLPAGAKSGFVRGTDGKWYVKPGTGTGAGGSTPKPNLGKPAQDVYKALVKEFDAGTISDQQDPGTGDLVRFLKKYQPDPGHFNAWFDDVLGTLKRVDPQYLQWIAGYVKRRKADGTWKGHF